MRNLVILAIHLLVTFAKLLRPGGVRAIAAESLLLKHQLLISNRARQRDPNLTATDHRWLASLRVLSIEEVKSIPYAPTSHPFIERLIGTVRREYLDHLFFWNAIDLVRKLAEFKDYYNAQRVHRSLAGSTPARRAGTPACASAALDHYAWRQHCRGLFHTLTAALT